MTITDKTRKTLWAKSGNRCAMCRIELIADKNEHNKNLNIAEECHLVSRSPNDGPRYSTDFNNDFDDYENLILLCRNDHRKIDELYETYTVDLLKKIKASHELWVRNVLDKANSQKDPVKILPRLKTGKQVVDVIQNAGLYHFDHDELTTQDEVLMIGGFLENLQDWGDVIGDFGKGRLIQLGFDLNSDIEEIEKIGFLIFGSSDRVRVTGSDKKDLGAWHCATLLVLRKENPAIIEGELVATVKEQDFKSGL